MELNENQFAFPSSVYCERHELVLEEDFTTKLKSMNLAEKFVSTDCELHYDGNTKTKWQMTFTKQMGTNIFFEIEATKFDITMSVLKVHAYVMLYAGEQLIGMEAINSIILAEKQCLGFDYKYNEHDLTRVVCTLTILMKDDNKTKLLEEMKSFFDTDVGAGLSAGIGADVRDASDAYVRAVNGKMFLVHKAILSARCRYFKDLFERESRQVGNKRFNKIGTKTTILCPQSEDATKEIIRFIYTGQVERLDRLAKDILPAAKTYRLDQLKAICEESLEAKKSTPKNKAVVINFVTSHGVTNVTITAADNSEFEAHKSMLTAKSTFFKHEFKNKLVYNEEKFNGGIIKEILRYIYTGQVYGLNDLDFTFSILEASSEYQLDHLQTICEDSLRIQMKETTTDNNAMKVKEFASKQGLENLRKAVDEFLLLSTFCCVSETPSDNPPMEDCK